MIMDANIGNFSSLTSDCDGKSTVEIDNRYTENNVETPPVFGSHPYSAEKHSGDLSPSFDPKIINTGEHALTLSHRPEFDGDSVSELGFAFPASLGSDSDLQHLENSIRFFDLYHSKAPLSLLQRSMSSRGSSPDLRVYDQVDSDENALNEQGSWHSLSPRIAKGDRKSLSSRITKRDMIAASAFHRKLNTSTLSHLRNQELDRTDQETDYLNYFDSVNSTFGRMHVRKVSSTKREREFGNSQNLEDAESGPDEISRYLESSLLNESYIDAVMDQEGQGYNLHEAAACNSNTDISSMVSELHTESFLSANEIPFAINSVQVIGAKQKRGGSSIWQRMVGVKNHTVYCIKVVSGKQEWEVQRRYRDFMNFYWQLKQVFNGHGSTLFLSLSEEVANDSRRVLGNTSPSIVESRVARIERFLQLLLQAGPPFSTATPLFWFLRPPQGIFETTGFEEHIVGQESSSLQRSVDVQLGTINTFSPSNMKGSPQELSEHGSPLNVGRIKLILTIHQNPSMEQVLRAQHHSCAKCFRHLEYEKGLFQGFVQAFGWGKPRYCEYTGQLFCSSCHSNELAVVPAYVLWHWDFTPKRVSQFSKSYLDSIYDQPLLCLSTANLYLYQRVPCLSKIQEIRTKLSRVLSCMRCDSRSRILNIMGSRRYFLESNDFFALRDLEDISKGAFAVLPGLLKMVLKTLSQHVTKQCSICQDSGEWCGAGILCKDSFQPIFPFDEENIVKCNMCNAPFHQNCFAKCSSCPSCPKNWVGVNPLNAS
ncbi:hypothetical protein KP509_30G059200 [Ceratopteris richardii]|uniref:PX domain-containing protein n=1 Tax=Ceratopteris richardii TaxID=49495 RepID=A0A8T2R3V3_CERRI|nr:hypothetical protein KP509_30G059200 [Ceratopteris richardii]KAH7290683.1 hypothetical protein KP509_30G059200 [Ceratopteris richardii]